MRDGCVNPFKARNFVRVKLWILKGETFVRQIQFSIDKIVRPNVKLGKDSQGNGAEKLDLLFLAGHSASAATSQSPHVPEEPEVPLIRVRRGVVTRRNQEVQTGPDVTTFNTRTEILSPSHGCEWNEKGFKLTCLGRSFQSRMEAANTT
eukprot:762994-Hanusia_phi.AAC.11